MNYIANKRVVRDKEYNGFKLRTRHRFHDTKIIGQILGGRDSYRLPENPKVVIDIGANIGVFSILAASKGADVYAFEPEQYNYETLCHNVKINNFSDKIRCINKGVGIPGMTKLFIHPENSGASSSYLENYMGLDPDHYQLVEFISIKDVFNLYEIDYCDLLKLDCECSERDIIKDLDADLIERIGQISAEIHYRQRKHNLQVARYLGKWYTVENTHRHDWVFKKKNG